MQKNKGIILIVILLGFLIIAGLMLLGYGIYMKSTVEDFKLFSISHKQSTGPIKIPVQSTTKHEQAKKPITITLNKNESIKTITTSNNKIIFKITDDSNKIRIIIMDTNSGLILNQIVFRQPQ